MISGILKRVIKMCTAFRTNSYFGRNLDLDISFGESVIITPKKFPFCFRKVFPQNEHFAIIGIGTISDGYPLYYDAMNETGLCMAGLNFPDNAYFPPIQKNERCIGPFELIPYVLGKCSTVTECVDLIRGISIADIHFSEKFPNTPLHWIVADKEKSVVIEPLKDGLKIHENPTDTLTNNPPFDYHLTNLSNYMSVTSDEIKNRFSQKIKLTPYSRGMGGLGLPGDLSSASRFIRGAFTLLNSRGDTLSHFFHILSSTEQQKGCARVGERYEFTLYSSCYDLKNKICFYTTYENRQISAVRLYCEDLTKDTLVSYPLKNTEEILYIN